MKHIRLVLEDKEYNKLIQVKGKLTWKEFLLLGVKIHDND